VIRLITARRRAELETQRGAADGVIEGLRAERDGLATTVEALTAERDRVTKAIATVTAERNRLREELRTAEPRLQARLDSAHEVITRQCNQLTALQNSNEAMTRELYDLAHPAVEEARA
jgi:chromosome segregation ATPase